MAGDVNSTMACTLAAKKLNLPVAHLEAGLRSFDRSMPEEINRIVTDSLADLVVDAVTRRRPQSRKGRHGAGRIVRVGNIMIDAFEIDALKNRSWRVWLIGWGLPKGTYGVMTIHRPANVDAAGKLAAIVDRLIDISRRTVPLVFPIHPRTRDRLEAGGLLGSA